jgi:hypothetical protein
LKPAERREPRRCLECDRPLTGRQQRFHSAQCGDRYRKRERRRAASEARLFERLDPDQEAILAPVLDQRDMAERILAARRHRDAEPIDYHVRGQYGRTIAVTTCRRDVVEIFVEEESRRKHWAKRKRAILPPDNYDETQVTMTLRTTTGSPATVKRINTNRKPALGREGARILATLQFSPPDEKQDEKTCRKCQRFERDCFGHEAPGAAALRITVSGDTSTKFVTAPPELTSKLR